MVKFVRRLDLHETSASSDSLPSKNLKIVSIPNSTSASGPLPGTTIVCTVDQFDDEWRFGFVVLIILIVVVLIVTLDTFPTIPNPVPNLLHLRIPLPICLNPLLRARPVRFVYDHQAAPDHPKLEGGICFSNQCYFRAEGAEDRDEGVSRQTAGRRRGASLR